MTDYPEGFSSSPILKQDEQFLQMARSHAERGLTTYPANIPDMLAAAAGSMGRPALAEIFKMIAEIARESSKQADINAAELSRELRDIRANRK
jgi:hypothetical protein